MDIENSPIWIWWKKYGEHIMAPMVVILLCLIWYQYFASNQLQEEINLNCGWGEDDYFCYCEKSEAMKLRNMVENPFDLSNLTIAGDYNATLDG